MKRVFLYLPIAIVTFLIGLLAACPFTVPPTVSDSTATEIPVKSPSSREKWNNVREISLDDIWSDDVETMHGEYRITKRCEGNPADSDCKVRIFRNGKLLDAISTYRMEWLEYGFLDLLGTGSKQLVVEAYSGGSNCCFSYEIYELEPKFKLIYSNTTSDEQDAIGGRLLVEDLNIDGIYELRQSVLTFNYFGSTNVFPPAIFEFDAKEHRYNSANRKYADHILTELDDQFAALKEWEVENGKLIGIDAAARETQKAMTIYTVYYLMYSGHRDEAWKFFEAHVQDVWKDWYRTELKKRLEKDPTYISIYGK